MCRGIDAECIFQLILPAGNIIQPESLVDAFLKLLAKRTLPDGPDFRSNGKKTLAVKITVEVGRKEQVGSDGAIYFLNITDVRRIGVVHFLSHGQSPYPVNLVSRQRNAVYRFSEIKEHTVRIILVLLVEQVEVVVIPEVELGTRKVLRPTYRISGQQCQCHAGFTNAM